MALKYAILGDIHANWEALMPWGRCEIAGGHEFC
jgi:hypothetical protein